MDLQRFLIIQHVDVIKLTIYMTSCWNLQDGMYAIHSPVFCYILGDRECFQDVFYDVFLATSNLKFEKPSCFLYNYDATCIVSIIKYHRTFNLFVAWLYF